MTTKTIKELQFSGLSGDVYVFTTPYAICSTGAITASDTINSAIGKLEKALDGVDALLASI